MDVILPIADDWVLDNVWAKLVPLVPANATTAAAESSRTWLSFLPSSLQPPSIDLGLLNHPTTAGLLSSLPAQSASAWPRDYILRQAASITFLTLLGINVLYFLFAALSYYFIFDHRMMRHPRYLKNQIKLEIQCSVQSFPGMTALTLPFFLAEVRGWTKLYGDVEEYGWTYLVASVPLFLVFTDYLIYWIHRWLHIPALYKIIHKPHHKWIVPTPFASHAFHPVDGWAQSVPYHLFILIFPMQRHLYLSLFVIINFWTIFIHDSDMFVSPNSRLEQFINTPAHHTLHHMYFTCNYGQYFTWADRSGGSYRAPQPELDPMNDVLALDKLGASLNGREKMEVEGRKEQ